MSNANTSSTTCDLSNCAGVAGVSVDASCLSDIHCLCSNPQVMQAVIHCLPTVCAPLDAVDAEVSLIEQCQLIESEIVSSALALPTSTPTPFRTSSKRLTSTSSIIASETSSSLTSKPRPVSDPRPTGHTSNAPSSPVQSITGMSSASVSSKPTEAAPLSTPSNSRTTFRSLGESTPHDDTDVPRISALPTSVNQPASTSAMTPPHGSSRESKPLTLPLSAAFGAFVFLVLAVILFVSVRRCRRRRLRRAAPPSGHLNAFWDEMPAPMPSTAGPAAGLRHSRALRGPSFLWLTESNFAQDGSRLPMSPPTAIADDDNWGADGWTHPESTRAVLAPGLRWALSPAPFGKRRQRAPPIDVAAGEPPSPGSATLVHISRY
ncbi:hypothetical protein C8Q78DRAFT_1082525 [Trametes maxima]|nr:hypothetical protein C8Q78DRAFT_1082525 [Trametes maxima]